MEIIGWIGWSGWVGNFLSIGNKPMIGSIGSRGVVVRIPLNLQKLLFVTFAWLIPEAL